MGSEEVEERLLGRPPRGITARPCLFCSCSSGGVTLCQRPGGGGAAWRWGRRRARRARAASPAPRRRGPRPGRGGGTREVDVGLHPVALLVAQEHGEGELGGGEIGLVLDHALRARSGRWGRRRSSCRARPATKWRAWRRRGGGAGGARRVVDGGAVGALSSVQARRRSGSATDRRCVLERAGEVLLGPVEVAHDHEAAPAGQELREGSPRPGPWRDLGRDLVAVTAGEGQRGQRHHPGRPWPLLIHPPCRA